MKKRIIFLQVLVPLLEQMARSKDPQLAAEAADEHASKAKELAKLRRAIASDTPTEGAGREVALRA